MHVDLTNGNSAELLDSLDGITNDERDSLEFAYAETGRIYGVGGQLVEAGSEARKLKALNRRLIELAVISWTLTEPIPKDDPSVLGRIKGLDGKRLEEAVWALKYSTEPIDTTLEAATDGEGKLSEDAPFLSLTPTALPSSMTA